MKRFKFSLQQVLDLKENQKKQAAQQLAALRLREQQIEARIMQLAQQWKNEHEALAKASSELLASEYRIRLSYLEYLDFQIDRERKRLAELAIEIAQKQQKVLEYSREENVLERLREQRQEKHVAEMQAVDQAFNDEIATQRAVFKVIDANELNHYVL